jgi:hypothetical protein
MQITHPHPAASSATRLPEGVSIVVRKPEDLRFDEVPRDWFAGSRVLSTALNLFSFIIPEHERFFIRTVRKYKSKVVDPEAAELLRAFMQQEAIHYQVHEAFNETRRHHGMDVDRDLATIKKTFAKVEERFSPMVRLGMTAFMEHCTAISAHIGLRKDSAMPYMHQTMRDLWEWHALEEIEHKAVAFDLFKESGGGYFLRIYTAILTIITDARLFRVLIRRARADAARQIADGTWCEPVLTDEQIVLRDRAIAIERRTARKLFWAGAAYFVPGFHPWKVDDSRYVKRVAETYNSHTAEPPHIAA